MKCKFSANYNGEVSNYTIQTCQPLYGFHCQFAIDHTLNDRTIIAGEKEKGTRRSGASRPESPA